MSLLFVVGISLILGLLFGSFLNVCIARLPGHQSVVSPRSHCPRCQHPLRWYDNAPIVSWLLLRGRCRDCQEAIAWHYPLVELATGLWFAAAGVRIYSDYSVYFLDANSSGSVGGFLSHLTGDVGFATLGFLLIGLVVMDWQTQLLPDAFTVTGTAIGMLLLCIRAVFLGPHEGDVILNTTHQLRMSSPGSLGVHGNIFVTGTESLLYGRVLGVAAAAGLLYLIRWGYQRVRHREGLGVGDIKLMAMMVAFLGFAPGMLALLLGTVGASVYGMLLLVRGKAGGASRLPLGSFLSVGGMIAAVYGNRLIEGYLALLR